MQPGGPEQGVDGDGDGYGECCDCDDADPAVHPGQNEIIYNRKDDDCDPSTPDGDCMFERDCDGDGFEGEFHGGSDCHDRDASIHPGAEEVCDGLDNDCDGAIDGPDCFADGGLPDGGDGGPICADISGPYHVLAYCIAFSKDPGLVVITQTGCNVAFNLDAIYCTGSLDEALNLYVSCAGLGVPCSAKASLTSAFRLTCSPQCSLLFEPAGSRTPCSVHYDLDCVPDGRRCGIVGENGSPIAVCVDVNPAGREPGYHCDATRDIYCDNSLCIEGACGAICAQAGDCEPFDGTSCQTVLYNDGQDTVGDIQACLPTEPGETRCGRSPDCESTRVCTYRQTDDEVITVCRSPNLGGRLPGEACLTGAECRDDLCLCGDTLCDGSVTGFCSALCVTDADCMQTGRCGAITIPDLGGMDQTVSACKAEPAACGRSADCPASQSCQVLLAQDGLSLVTRCLAAAGPGSDNTGAPCTNDTGCFSLWCNREQDYCIGTCLGDADCRTYSGDPIPCPGGDADCGLEQLCFAFGRCTRPFECASTVFWLGFDQWGQKVYDTVKLCRPVRRACESNQACRAGEACTIESDPTASFARTACYPGFGPGQLGADCTLGGSDACWTGLCIRVGDGGPDSQYCSQACVTAADCGSLDQWDCQAIRIDVRPGFVSYLPACLRR
jgi:hypothetical protein